MRRSSLLICLMLLTVAQAARAAPQPAAEQDAAASGIPATEMDVGAYLAELDRVATIVAVLPQNPESIAPLRASLPNAWVVRGAGQRFAVPTDWLTSTLATMENSPQLRSPLKIDLLRHLDLLRSEAKAFGEPGSGPNAGTGRARIEEILHRREFDNVNQPGKIESWKQRIGAWLSRMFRRMFSRLFNNPRTGELLIWVFAVMLFLLLAYVVVRLLMRTARFAQLSVDAPVRTGKTWREWAREALDAASQGDFRDAIHRGYWAGVFRLRDLGALRLERDRTPREYLRMLGEVREEQAARTPSGDTAYPAPSEQRAALISLTRRLEEAWYGCHAATEIDFRETIQNLEALGCRFPSTQQTVES